MGAFTNSGGPPSTQRKEEDDVQEVEVDTSKDSTVEPEKEEEQPVQDVKTDSEEPTEEPKKEEEPEPEPEKKEEEPEGFKTDVKDLYADGEHKVGIDSFPVFKVTKSEFYQNMKHGRRRLRFGTGSKAQQYMKGTRYNRPFYIQYTDSKGKTYSRKIK